MSLNIHQGLYFHCIDGRPGTEWAQNIYVSFCKLWSQGVPMSTIAEACGVTVRCCQKWQKPLRQYGLAPSSALDKPYAMSLADEEARLDTLQSLEWMYQDQMQA